MKVYSMVKSAISGAMGLALVFAANRVIAETYTDANGLVWTYTVSSGKATLSGVSKQNGGEITGTLVIPSTVDGMTVSAIGANSFQNLPITQLIVADSVITLNAGAFANCSALLSVTLGNGLVTIAHGRANYSGHSANTASPDTYASSGVFGNCLNLETVAFGGNLVTIGAHAFSECQALKSLDFPDSLQTIGENCFYDNIRLTRVTFGADLKLIGQCAFMGCPSLSKVTFSASTTPLLTIKSNAFRNCVTLTSLVLSDALTTLEANAFAGCTLLRRLTIPSVITTVANDVFSNLGNLKEVYFMGLPPENIANAGLPADIKIRYSSEYAEDWEPVIASCGFTNAAVYDSGSDSGDGSGTVSGSLALTVTNVVVHYVTSSLPSDAVIPSEAAGIVNVIAEVNAGKAVAITADWAKQYPAFTATFGADFTKALTMQTGKCDGAGNPMLVWQDFVAGTDPTDPEDVFTASITFDRNTGDPVISWSPELSAAEAAKRVYKVLGKVKLTDAVWTEVNGNTADFNFFKVSVEMK